MDHTGRIRSQSRIYNASSNVTRSALVVANNFVGSKKSDEYQEFIDSCWCILQSLQLYNKPQRNMYALKGTLCDIPFEAMDSATLATLRGNATTDPLAAYVILMMSELGHRYSAFREHGWPLLRLLSQNGHIKALLKTVYELFSTYTISIGRSAFETAEFLSLFESFWKINTSDKNYEEIKTFIDWTLSDKYRISQSDSQNEYFIIFWTHVVFSNRGWTTSKNCILVLEHISRVCFELGYLEILTDSFATEYRKIFEGFKPSHTYSASFPSSIKIIYGFAAGAIETFIGPQFPTLVSDKASKSHYFSLFALLVETLAEKEFRHMLGLELLKNSNLALEAHQDKIKKPIRCFVIYRWLGQLLKMEITHPLIALYFQVLN